MDKIKRGLIFSPLQTAVVFLEIILTFTGILFILRGSAERGQKKEEQEITIIVPSSFYGLRQTKQERRTRKSSSEPLEIIEW